MSGGWKKQVQEDAKPSTFPVSWLRHAIKLWTWQQSSEITKKVAVILATYIWGIAFCDHFLIASELAAKNV